MKTGVAFTFALISCIGMACRQKPAAEQIASGVKAADSIVFYPTADLLKKEIETVDSTPYFIYRIRVRNGKKDSMPISKREFDSMARMFVAVDISDSSIKKKYKESAFDDASTESLTLNYSTQDSGLYIRSIDLLLAEDDQHVKRIFMSTFERGGDSSVAAKLGWKPGRNFYINRLIYYANGQEVTEENRVVWDERE